MAEQSLTEQLITWLWQWRTQGFPHNIQHSTLGYMLDWLGSALAGQHKSAPTAAFVKATLSHIVEMDDLDRDSVMPWAQS